MNAAPHSDPARPAPAPLCPILRDGINRTSGLILSILLALAAATVGIGLFAVGAVSESGPTLSQGIAIGSLVLFALYLWRVTRTSKGILPILVIAGIFVFYFTGSIELTAALIGLLFAIGEGSFLLAVLPRKLLGWFPMILLAAYGAALAVTRDPVGAAAVLLPFPPMLVLAQSTRRAAASEDGPTRVGVICATALALGATMVALTALELYLQLGSLSPEALAGFMEELREALIESITSAEIPEGLAPEMVEQLEEMKTYANAQNTVNSAFNLLPALFVVMVNIISAVVQMMQHASLRTFGYGDSISNRVRAFGMSLISCIVFPVAYLVVFLEGSDASSLAGTIAQNIYVILLPGLALAGVIRIMGGLARKGPRNLGCLFYLFLLVPCLLILAPFIPAAVEVIGHIYGAITSAIKPPEDDDPFGPF